ncbi:MAG: histidine--tRNA ligase [Chloroflexi bacterium]|nr:histidine--tRNA ligase [Chloroflexota bacterium]
MLTSESGFPEWLPADRLVEQAFIDTIRQQFELYGFAPLETRAVEPVDVLLAKGETDKEIYVLSRLQADEDEPDEASLGLHFDLTVPFARFVTENQGRLTFPIRRYQIQKAWRGERPQAGRFREFYQADIDIIERGDLPITADLELIQALHDVVNALPVPRVRIHLNNRKLLEGFYRALGIEDIQETLRIADKLDKVGADGVRAMLIESGLGEAAADACLALSTIQSGDAATIRERVAALGQTHDLLDEGLAELAFVLEGVRTAHPDDIIADLSIARGLDYYTGTVVEGKFADIPDFPTVCSGGRYDNLAAGKGDEKLPGMGVSIGITRILSKVLAEGHLRASRRTPSCVLVALVDEETRQQSSAVAYALRQRGIPCEVYNTPDRFGKQIRYADRMGIPFVWFPGTDGADEVKDIRSGDQSPADPASWEPPAEDWHVRIEEVEP